jgi:hypothetical protein
MASHYRKMNAHLRLFGLNRLPQKSNFSSLSGEENRTADWWNIETDPESVPLLSRKTESSIRKVLWERVVSIAEVFLLNLRDERKPRSAV